MSDTPMLIPGHVGSYFLGRDGREYRKTATIRAQQMDRSFVVQSPEGDHSGRPGDWLAQNPAGELYVIDDAVFRETYEPVGEANGA